MNKSNCTSCGADILWVKLKSGKSNPLDPEIIVSDGTKILYVDEMQEFKKVAPGRKGYQSHFSSCPDANKFRKGKQKNEKE